MRGRKFREGKAGKLRYFKSKIDVGKLIKEYNDTNAKGVKTKSWIGDALTAIGDFFEEVGCVMTGGSWSQFNEENSWDGGCSDDWTFDWFGDLFDGFGELLTVVLLLEFSNQRLSAGTIG